MRGAQETACLQSIAVMDQPARRMAVGDAIDDIAMVGIQAASLCAGPKSSGTRKVPPCQRFANENSKPVGMRQRFRTAAG